MQDFVKTYGSLLWQVPIIIQTPMALLVLALVLCAATLNPSTCKKIGSLFDLDD